MFANVSHGLEATLVHGLVELRLPAEETWGDLGRFDYQGMGVHDVVINNVTCDTFRMRLCFHHSCCSGTGWKIHKADPAVGKPLGSEWQANS